MDNLVYFITNKIFEVATRVIFLEMQHFKSL